MGRRFYALLAESGSVNINWNEMYGDSMLSADRKAFGPVFYGLQMLHTIVHRPGDLLVDARSSSSLVTAHAALRRDGYVGLMLINKDPQYPATVKVTLRNGVIGSDGRRIDYGSAQFVVLNNNQSIAKVPQLQERIQQSFVITLMQTYGRLI